MEISKNKMQNTKNYQQNPDTKNLILVIFLIFILTAFFSYILTFEYHKAVYLDEEANFAKVLDADNLNELYKLKIEEEKRAATQTKENLRLQLEAQGKSQTEIQKALTNFRKYPVIILGYHQIREYKNSDGPKTKLFITKPEVFEKEMKYLFENNYKTISITDYINYLNSLHTNNQDNNQSDAAAVYVIPEKSVILTFDDGYVSQYTTALPILKKYNFTATFFVYKDCVDQYPACMTSQNLKDLINDSMKLANHSTSHAFLTKYTDSGVKKEILENQKWLLENFSEIGLENILAYPYGANDKRVQKIVREFGFLGAAGTGNGHEKNNLNLFNLHRYLLGNNYDLFESIFQ